MAIEKTFLLVSNDEGVGIVFQKSFPNDTTYLHFTTNEMKAREFFRSVIPDLIVLDLKLLSATQAVELVRQIRANRMRQSIPIVILSKGVESDLNFFMSGAGPLIFFREPFDWLDVVAAAKEILSAAD